MGDTEQKQLVKPIADTLNGQGRTTPVIIHSKTQLSCFKSSKIIINIKKNKSVLSISHVNEQVENKM